jgi:hypothetical protein
MTTQGIDGVLVETHNFVQADAPPHVLVDEVGLALVASRAPRS